MCAALCLFDTNIITLFYLSYTMWYHNNVNDNNVIKSTSIGTPQKNRTLWLDVSYGIINVDNNNVTKCTLTEIQISENLF